MTSTALPRLFSDEEAAEYLHTASGTLAVWRCTGRVNLPYVKIGRRVLYREDDLKAFIESRIQGAQA